jgi:hypothetical protein
MSYRVACGLRAARTISLEARTQSVGNQRNHAATESGGRTLGRIHSEYLVLSLH